MRDDRLNTIAQPELREGMRNVRAHRRLAHEEPRGNSEFASPATTRVNTSSSRSVKSLSSAGEPAPPVHGTDEILDKASHECWRKQRAAAATVRTAPTN